MFGTKNGWERADYHEPGSAWRRAGADQRAFGWARAALLDAGRAEDRRVRERVGMIDMTSFGKIAVEGPGALALLERVCAQPRRRARSAASSTRSCSTSAAGSSPTSRSRASARSASASSRAPATSTPTSAGCALPRRRATRASSSRDETDDVARDRDVGPARARRPRRPCTDDDVSGAALPFRRAAGARGGRRRRCWRSGSPTSASSARSSTSSRAWAVQVWDGSRRRGRAVRPRARRLPRARLAAHGEGLPLLGTDLTAGDTPDEAGLGFCVALDARAIHRRARPSTAQRAARPAPRGAHAARRRRRLPCASTAARPSARRRGGRARAQRRLRLHGRPDARVRVPAAASSRRPRRRGRGVRRRTSRPSWPTTALRPREPPHAGLTRR